MNTFKASAIFFDPRVCERDGRRIHFHKSPQPRRSGGRHSVRLLPVVTCRAHMAESPHGNVAVSDDRVMQVQRYIFCSSSISRQPLSLLSPTFLKVSLPQRQRLSHRHQSLRFAGMASATTFYDFKPKDKKGSEYPLANLKGKVVLVVNTASKCGFTPQFEGLEKLYKGKPTNTSNIPPLI